MKLFFLNNDTLYKIFSTIEKVPKSSQITIFIESENQFFKNHRRAKQIYKLIQERWIHAIFMAESNAQKEYFEVNWLAYEFKKKQTWRTMMQLLYRFFFNIKKFHLYIHQKKNYTTIAIFWAEVIFLIAILYFLYSLILPKTIIEITPSYQVNEIAYNFRYIAPEYINEYPYKDSHIVIPLYRRLTTISESMTIDGEKVQYTSHPAKGKIRLVNKTKDIIPLMKNTQLINEDWILFTIDKSISIPAATSEGNAWYIETTATSKEVDNNGELIGSKGNIIQWSELTIKNLKQSKYTKDIYAEAMSNFIGGTITKSGNIVQSDIGILQKKLYEQLSKNKITQIKKNTTKGWEKDVIILPFEDFYHLSWCAYLGITDIQNIITGASLWWTLSCTIEYFYVTQSDIKKATEQYMDQRKSNIHEIITINTDSINFIQLMSWSYNSYIIPTKINIIQWYDFQKDINDIKNSISDKVLWLPEDKAKNVILSYPEISNVTISISPPRYNLISNLKSRIFIKVVINKNN